VLLYVLRETLKLVHPIIPFVTEEIYDALPNKDAEDIMISPYPVYDRKRVYRKDVATTEMVMEVIKSIRNLRREMNVSQNKRTAIHIVASEGMEKTAKKIASYIEKLAMGSSVSFNEPEGKNASLVTALGKIFIPMGDLIDFDKERERIKAEIAKTDDEIARAQGKLNNQGFVAKAPVALIEKEKEKLEKYIELKKGLEESLKNLD
jgi:valyl-tRNA synthetase